MQGPAGRANIYSGFTHRVTAVSVMLSITTPGVFAYRAAYLAMG